MNTLLRLRYCLVAATLSCTCLSPAIFADDTEIFFGQSNDAFNTNPNVLFVLDTSGSMTNFDDTNSSRMDRMKTAMRTLLEQSSSFNVGLMGFSGYDRGGSIRYPVGDLEGDSGDLCDSADGTECPDEVVIVRPGSGSDDATQNDDTLEVTLDSPSLIMAGLTNENDNSNNIVIESNIVDGSVSASNVSAEYLGLTDPVSRSVTSIANWFYNPVAGENNRDRYAYRFENLNIPKNATITAANLHFSYTNALSNQSGNVTTKIKLESVASSTPLPDGSNGTDSISLRLDPTTATAGVEWDVPAVTGGETTATSPDISSILQQLVILPQWAAGNPVTVLLDPVEEYSATANDVREFYGLDAAPSLHPTLTYSYSETIASETVTTTVSATAHLDEITNQNNGEVSRNLSNASSQLFFANEAHFPRELAFRFDNINIPANAEITLATLVLTGANPNSGDPEDAWIVDPSTSPTIVDPTLPAELPPLSEPTSASSITAPVITDPTASAPENVILGNIKAELTGSPAPYSNTPLIDRTISTEFVTWTDIVPTGPNAEISSPNIADIVTAVISQDDWTAGDTISLVLTPPRSTYNNVLENTSMIRTSASADKPQLYITWKETTVVDTTLNNSQTTAIRFQNVHVPPGAEIKTAALVFNSDSANIGETQLEISAELSADSEPFVAANNNIGQRIRSSQRVNWIVPPWENPHVDYTSVDISSVVNSVTNLPEWCSGNPLTLFIKKQLGDDNRIAKSYESNPLQAPTLRITYEASSVNGGFCSNSTALANIVSNKSDAVEDVSNNIVYLDESTLDTINSTTNAAQTIGLRFSGVAIDPGTPVVNAVIELTPAEDIVQAVDMNIEVSSDTQNSEFSATDPDRKIIIRPPLPTTVVQTIPPMPADLSRATLDVTDLVNAKIASADWTAGQRMMFSLESLSTQNQSFYSFDGNDALAPRLIISYQSIRENPGTRFRENLISIVDELVAQDYTPIVSTYYEAALYFTGQEIDYGLRRGDQGNSDRFHRVSHPASYTNGRVIRNGGCSDANLDDSSCRSEIIVSDGTGAPTYISPMTSECQQNHIVLLSDGEPTSNTAANKVRAMTGDTTCEDADDEECGVELATYLNNFDLNDELGGMQNITTHTIGFNLDEPAFLTAIAEAGGGDFYSTESTAQLLAAFQSIFNNVSRTDTTFVAPSATVSQSNRLKNRDDLYFSLFKPEGTARWDGNLKRYKLSADSEEDADIRDAANQLAIDPNTGMFVDSARSWWTNAPDGNNVANGGAAGRLDNVYNDHFFRNVYTFTGHSTDLANTPSNALLPNTEYFDNDWLKLPGALANDTDYIQNLVYWARGRDEFDIDGDDNTDEVRGQMGDPLHTQPVLVNYAGDRTVVHIATNEGFLHAIDHDSGDENFAFIPTYLLKNLADLYENEPTRNRPYGIDGGMSVWIKDINKNGIVDPGGDKAYLYFGLRRGGSKYYALDITDPDKPKYMWSITGGATTSATEDPSGLEDLTTADGDFQQLGQTWSKPTKTKIYDGNVIRDVLVFGAGYDENQDTTQVSALDDEGQEIIVAPTRTEDNVGRGFFIVDALTGNQLWKPNIEFDPDYSQMKYSVPSDIRVIDLNFDGLADQFYFGDMGGQVWRFDYDNNPHNNESMENRMDGGVIGSFAVDDDPEQARRFYYPPDVALINIDGEQQLSISIGSGWRAHPLDTIVKDQFYSFRMKQVYGTPVDSDGEVRYPPLDQSYTTMHNVSEDFVATKNTRGWYIDLDAGEKVLSSSITVDNKLVFTSYVPTIASGDACAAAIGSGYVYVVDLASGKAVYNLAAGGSAVGGSAGTGGYSRRKQLSHSGIPPAPSILFPELGKATTFVGRDKIEELEIPTLKTRTFWQEFVESDL